MGEDTYDEDKQKYRFRELHFVCRDNLIIHPHYPSIEVYSSREIAEKSCKHWQVSYRWMWNGWPGAFRIIT